MPQADATQPLELSTQAAWAYYHDGMKQSDIATLLKVSRASVVNYLAEARARGYVRVTMHPDVFVEHQLGTELADAYGLQHALVVPDGASAQSSLQRVSKAAADWYPSRSWCPRCGRVGSCPTRPCLPLLEGAEEL